MASDSTFTGERFLPGCEGEIAYEHWHRYAFARRFATGKRVLDAACGEGYGAALLGSVAQSVVGVDIDGRAIAQATARYGKEQQRFVTGSCTSLSFPDATFDLVVSFETVEHLAQDDQPRMLAEFARVLRRDGVLIMSSPNKRLYSDARNYVNEFHLHELYRDGLERLLEPSFPAQRWHHQRVAPWSAIWAEGGSGSAEAWLGRSGGVVEPYVPPEGMYFIVVAARHADALAATASYSSLFTDAEDSEQRRNETNAREVLRLDALLKERDAALDLKSRHAQHLEALVAQHARVIADQERSLSALDALRLQQETELAKRSAAIAALEARLSEVLAVLAAEQERLEAELAAQQRIIAYRQSARWWLRLPWLRVKLLLARGR